MDVPRGIFSWQKRVSGSFTVIDMATADILIAARSSNGPTSMMMEILFGGLSISEGLRSAMAL